MARTALIVGLGGTGQWVLTHLKKDLLEAYEGSIPSNVRLLCFDTNVSPGANVNATISEGESKRASLGTITLEPDKEYVHLEGNAYEDTKAICEEKGLSKSKQHWNHISSWFQSCDWLETLDPYMFVFSNGCSQVRQLGRFSLFFDLQDKGRSKVYRSVTTAINQLRTYVKPGDKLEIFVVGSFAGGTGSGLFIDIGLLLRKWAGADSHIRAYYVLPHAFTPDPTVDMLARCFAAWRELNRFMTITQQFYLPTIQYNKTDGIEVKGLSTKLFDNCYLVDGYRNNAALMNGPERVVFPTISDAIGALLDENFARKFEEWSTDITTTLVKNRGKSLFSTVGSYSFQVPVFAARQNFSEKFALSWIEELVKPRIDPEHPGIIKIDPTSPSDPSKIGRDEALSLLTTVQENQPEPGQERISESPTIFFKMIADVIKEGGVNNLDLISSFARGSWQGRTFAPFIDLGSRQGIAGVIQQINAEAKLNVPSTIKTSKDFNKEDTRRFPDRAEKEFKEFERIHYGFKDVHGLDNKGRFGEQLVQCSKAQLGIFERLLHYWVIRTLNDENTKAGRIGYCYDLLVGLVGERSDSSYKGALINFLEFLDDIKKKRMDVNPAVKVQQEGAQAKQLLLSFAGKKVLGLIDDPRVHQTQISYLNALQKIIDVRKDEILSHYVADTLRGMIQMCEGVRDELERWIRILTTGDPKSGDEGLFVKFNNWLKLNGEPGKEQKNQLPIRTYIGEIAYPEKQQSELLSRLMSSLKWIKQISNPFTLSLSVLDEIEEVPDSEKGKKFMSSLTQESLENVKSYAIDEFNSVNKDTIINIADILCKKYEGKPEKLAKDIGNNAEILFQRQPKTSGGAALWGEFIRIPLNNASVEAKQFIDGKSAEKDEQGVEKVVQDGLLQERRKQHLLPTSIEQKERKVCTIESEDTYKCTIIRTEELIDHQLFKAWHDCKEAYLNPNVSVPAYLNHNFAAEANAAKYERKIAKKRKIQIEIFHPWVVMLLEEPTRLKQFFLCYAFGWISLQSDTNNNWYEIRTPTDPNPFYLTSVNEKGVSLFQAARSFVLDGLDKSLAESVRILDYESIQKDLDSSERNLGLDGMIDFLRNQIEGIILNDTGEVVLSVIRDKVAELSKMQNKNIEENMGEPSDYEQAYHDLTSVAEIMFDEMLEIREMKKQKIEKNR